MRASGARRVSGLLRDRDVNAHISYVKTIRVLADHPTVINTP